MKKTIVFFSLLVLPFWAAAQWTVNLKAGAGIAKEIEREVIPSDPSNGLSYSTFSTLGYSYRGGVDVNYFFSRHLGLGSGLAYSYSRSLNDFMKNVFWITEYWHSQTLKVPVSLLWKPGVSGRSILQFGFSAEINLRHHEYDTREQSFTYRDHPFFLGVHLGYEYKLFNRFKLGVLLNQDITWFRNQIWYSNSLKDVFKSVRRYYFTPQITLSYKLFGKSGGN